MVTLIEQKLQQAERLVAASGVDAWLTFVRETSEGGDPVLPFLVSGGLTWQSALLITSRGERIAIVGNFDADPLRAPATGRKSCPMCRAFGSHCWLPWIGSCLQTVIQVASPSTIPRTI